MPHTASPAAACLPASLPPPCVLFYVFYRLLCPCAGHPRCRYCSLSAPGPSTEAFCTQNAAHGTHLAASLCSSRARMHIFSTKTRGREASSKAAMFLAIEQGLNILRNQKNLRALCRSQLEIRNPWAGLEDFTTFWLLPVIARLLHSP